MLFLCQISFLFFKGGNHDLCIFFIGPMLHHPLSYLPNLSARAGYDTRSIFKRSLTGLNSEFSF